MQIPDDCDLCQAALKPFEMAPQTVRWRTPEQVVANKVKISVPFVVEVREKTSTWYQQAGTYFLCQSCRNRLRPPLARALLYGLGAAVISLLPSFLLLGDGPLWFVLLGPGVAFGLGVLLGARPETLDAHLLGALWGTTESTEDGESRDFGPKILLLSA